MGSKSKRLTVGGLGPPDREGSRGWSHCFLAESKVQTGNRVEVWDQMAKEGRSKMNEEKASETPKSTTWKLNLTTSVFHGSRRQRRRDTRNATPYDKDANSRDASLGNSTTKPTGVRTKKATNQQLY